MKLQQSELLQVATSTDISISIFGIPSIKKSLALMITIKNKFLFLSLYKLLISTFLIHLVFFFCEQIIKKKNENFFCVIITITTVIFNKNDNRIVISSRLLFFRRPRVLCQTIQATAN